jgi:septal ring factor EnvC (AmiA/AmiB activator)
MANTQTRYLVRFHASAGIHRDGDVVALDAQTFAKELTRRPIALELLEEWHETLDGNGVVTGCEITPAPPKSASPAAAAESELVLAHARIAELDRDLGELREKVVLGTDPARARLEEEAKAMKKRIEELEAAVAKGATELADARGAVAKAETDLAAAKARVAELEAAAPSTKKNREGGADNKRG